MPDIVSVIGRRWKLITILTAIATVVAFLASLLSPKQYLGSVTAIPANPVFSDKARIFNPNIEALYAELGTLDDLDRLEGTAKLDTIYLATANEFNLAAHYGIDTMQGDAPDKAALRLKKNTTVNRTGYGELKIKVWDKDNQMAADLANAILRVINSIYRQVQTENMRTILQRLKEESSRQLQNSGDNNTDSVVKAGQDPAGALQEKTAANRMLQYQQLIAEYELALKTTPNALLVVEGARPSPWVDKPKTAQIVLFAFLGSLLFSVFLAFFVESRREGA
jgi:hypothetical protein